VPSSLTQNGLVLSWVRPYALTECRESVLGATPS
jgi:hypothetical protein